MHGQGDAVEQGANPEAVEEDVLKRDGHNDSMSGKSYNNKTVAAPELVGIVRDDKVENNKCSDLDNNGDEHESDHDNDNNDNDPMMKSEDDHQTFLVPSDREDGALVVDYKNGNSNSNSHVNEGVNHESSSIDRGYAWVIVVAVFLIHFLHIGYLKSGGVYFVEFQRKFKSNASMTSLVIGLADGIFSMSAPLIFGVLLKFASIRQSCLLGSLVLVVGIVGNIVFDRIEYLILTHSLGFGLAKALLLGPSFIIINDYFLKRRALATTVATTGASFGGIAFPLFARYFFDTYAFWGGMLLTGGVCMHSFIASALMTPISHQNARHDTDTLEDEFENEQNSKFIRNENGSIIVFYSSNEHLSSNEVDENFPKTDDNDSLVTLKTDSDQGTVSGLGKHLDVGRNGCKMELDEDGTFHNVCPDSHLNCIHLDNQIKDTSPNDVDDQQQHTRKRSHSSHSQQQPENHSNKHRTSFQNIYETNHNHSHLNDPNRLQVSMGNPESKNYHSQKSLSKSIIFHSTSTLNNTLADVITIENEFNQNLNGKAEEKNMSIVQKLFHRFCDNPLLRSATFWVLIPFYFAGPVGAGLPQIYFMPFAKERDLTDEQAALCLSVMNAMDIIAHIAPGVILNNFGIKSTTVSIIPMAITWILGHLTSFFYSFEALMTMSVIYGIFVGFFYALQSLYVIDVLGIENYSFSMGFYYLVMGVGGAASFPIAGALRDLTGTYSTTFHYLATMQCLCVFLLLVLPFVRRFDVRRGILQPG